MHVLYSHNRSFLAGSGWDAFDNMEVDSQEDDWGDPNDDDDGGFGGNDGDFDGFNTGNFDSNEVKMQMQMLCIYQLDVLCIWSKIYNQDSFYSLITVSTT